MKKILFLLFLLMFSVPSLKSQGIPYSLSCKVVKSFQVGWPAEKTIEQGKVLTLKKLTQNAIGELFYYAESGNEAFKIAVSDLDNVSIDMPSNKFTLWQYIRIRTDLDKNLLQNGNQYDLRKELEDESNDLIQNYIKYNLLFEDEYLYDYLQALLYRIHFITREDGRPGNLTIRVLINNEPNAFCLPNGSILVTTGLLSVLRSEEELLAVLAHEVAHFELDHQILNINKANERQKRAEFWAGFATTLAAAADIYVSVKNDQYIPGTVTLATAALSSEIASYVIDRLGIKYSYKQEIEADDAAAQVMKYLDMNPKTLSSALSRIKNYCIQTRKFYALSGSGTHPTLDKRIARIGDVDPESFNNVKYDRIISLVNSNNSIMEFDNGNINAAVELCDRNISAGVPTEMDYLVKAMAIRLLNDTPEKNQEAMDLIDKAKTLNITPFSYLFKQEGITLLRLGKNKEAVEAFNSYLNGLLQENSSDYVDNEVLWTRKMIAKSIVFAI